MTNSNFDQTVRALEQGELPAWITDHARRYQETGGKEGHLWDSSVVGSEGMKTCLLLTTRGRKSGRTYTHPLLYGTDGPRYIIVGSKGGSDQQPNWYYNLVADPNVTVQVMADVFPARAVRAEGAERARLWEIMIETYPPYIDYQSRTTRELPVFALERIGG